MIVYQNNKSGFCNDVLTNNIDKIIQGHIHEKTGKKVAKAEITAFKNSLEYMDRILQDRDIPNDCSVSIEYHLPQTSKRVDFIIAGRDNDHDNVIIIELKQWTEARLTSRDGIIETRFRGGISQTSHPSYQAWSYAALLQAFNSTVADDNIALHPCAYLHNYEQDEVIKNSFYSYYLEKAPVFLKSDAVALRNFIKRFMKFGDSTDILLRIDNGKIRPTKSLADAIASMLRGNQEFVMIDDQKVIFETARSIARRSSPNEKNVVIVTGGPGTGKSVLAVKLLASLIQEGILAQYVTKTSAPREVYFSKLQGQIKKVELKGLFTGSGSFMQTAPNIIGTLLVDEAHRLTEKTGFLKQGDNQVREIIRSSTCSIFFIDEDQRVHLDDYGSIQRIENIARLEGAEVHQMALSSQFRCNGSDGYLAWLDNSLQIRETANAEFSTDLDYTFHVFDDPSLMRNFIRAKNKEKNKARIVAGYCWDWKSDKNANAYDISIPEYQFNMRWNLRSYGPTWIIDAASVEEAGCIHTCQGLEVDHIGVIIGDDLIVRNGKVITRPEMRSRMDKSIAGYKKRLKENPEETNALLERIIKNTYRTLMSRGMKSCSVFCTDEKTRDYFKERAGI